MPTTSIPVDLANPGQVFACLGFLEAADLLCGEAKGGFCWQDSGDTKFFLAASGAENPIEHVLRFLEGACVISQAPQCSKESTTKWKIKTVSLESGMFPFPEPKSPATLPARLENPNFGNRHLTIDHWGDTTRDNCKFWAGSGGYPGAGFVRDALDLARRGGGMLDHVSAPFALAGVMSSSLRFDWRRDYVPLDAGFSPNAHTNVVMQGYPIVELMAAVGLTHARPLRQKKLEYSYGVAGCDRIDILDIDLYDPMLVRATLGARQALFPGLPFRLFTMRLDWPGQAGQARCITNVVEETPA